HRQGRSPHEREARQAPDARGRSGPLPLFRSRHRRKPAARRVAFGSRRRAHPGGRAGMTKQSEARAQVLDLIDRLGVGEAIPSERRLTVDLGMSRLTVRAALDELVREGYLVRRRGAGTFVGEPKVAKGMDASSFTDDMRARGLTPASRTIELRVIPAGARLGRMLHVSPSEP